MVVRTENFFSRMIIGQEKAKKPMTEKCLCHHEKRLPTQKEKSNLKASSQRGEEGK